MLEARGPRPSREDCFETLLNLGCAMKPLAAHSCEIAVRRKDSRGAPGVVFIERIDHLVDDLADGLFLYHCTNIGMTTCT